MKPPSPAPAPPADWWGEGPPPWERWSGASLRLDDAGGRYHFDAAAADQACDFFPTYLRHVKGDFAGQPFELLPWQRDLIVRPLFGWKRADGTRRFRKAFLEVGKKNGKSGLASGMGLLLAFGDNPMTQHDGPLSVLRGWRPQELLALARSQGFGARARVRRFFPYRLVLVVERGAH